MQWWKGALFGVLLMVLSGCSSASVPHSTDGPISKPTAQGGGGTAAIQGVVIDDENLPIEAAQVGLVSGLLESPLSVVTDAGGTFAFTDLPAGAYNLVAQKIGYRAPEPQAVAVGEDETKELEILLRPVPAAVPHTVKIPDRGILSWWAIYAPATGASPFPLPMGGQLPVVEFDTSLNWNTTDDPSAIEAMVVEVKWTSNQPTTEELRVRVFVEGKFNGNAGVPPQWSFVDTEATNPIRVVVPKERVQEILATGAADANTPYCRPNNHPDVPYCKMASLVTAATGNTDSDQFDFGIAVEQHYELAVSIFYRMQPDPDYSFFA